MTGEPKRKRSLSHRLERLLLGFGMSIGAWIIERRVLRTLKRKGEAPKPEPGAPLAGGSFGDVRAD